MLTVHIECVGLPQGCNIGLIWENAFVTVIAPTNL